MENFDKYLNEKMNDDKSINEDVNARDKQFNNYLEYNWYVDKQLSFLENLGGNNEGT